MNRHLLLTLTLLAHISPSPESGKSLSVQVGARGVLTQQPWPYASDQIVELGVYPHGVIPSAR